MNLAIPILENKIAPCFEVAGQFNIVTIKNGKVTSSKTVKCLSNEEFFRIRLLRLHEINTLICGGIKSVYRNQLTSMGIIVIPNVNNSIEEIIDMISTGEFKYTEGAKYEVEINELVSHDVLVGWARELFESNGYSVLTSPGGESFLIDLIAKIKCPLCGKTINVAVCCGAQIYSADREIREFHHNTKAIYDARVYVYLSNPQLEKSCNEYGIEFLCPEAASEKFIEGKRSLIPLLRRPLEGHEKAFSIEA